MMPQRRILAFSFFPAYLPPSNGGVERLYRFYSLLSHDFDVTLITSGEIGGERQVVTHSAKFKEIRVPKDNVFVSTYEELAKAAGTGDLSGPALGLSNRTYNALHDEYLEHYATADFVIHDSPFLIECDLFRGFDQKARVYNSYNFETGLYRSFHSEGRQDTVIEDLVDELERDLCAHANLITACSDDDRQAFERAFAPTAPIILVPNGYFPQAARPLKERKANRIIFLGSNHRPNVDAARQIIEKLAPAFPKISFHLVGSCHKKFRKDNVTAHGFVDGRTKASLLHSATLAINPVTSGSGSSLKIADIAISGIPLLSTEIGARGFNLEPGRHYIRLDEDDLVGSFKTALYDGHDYGAVAETSKAHFSENYSWPAIVRGFVDQLNRLNSPRHTPPVLVVNDYDSLRSTGGGATRTSGLCRGLAESGPVIFIAFNEDGGPVRRVSPDGRMISLLVTKSKTHQAEHDADNLSHWMSTADIVNSLEAVKSKQMLGVFRCAASICSDVICEHPYMVSLPRMFGIDFVYSSQNFEYALKSHSLLGHPRFAERIATVLEAERYACGASSLIIAVSENDARGLSGHYRFTAPIMVIENGADGPHGNKLRPDNVLAQERPTAIFMGSAHGPNLEAAQWIVNTLAPAMPLVDFAILGTVADVFTDDPADNVRLIGQVSAEQKSDELHAARVAINPMQSGGGSNIKMADYLQHGLPVVSTDFGVRGYSLPSEDVVVTDLDKFQESVETLLNSTSVSPSACVARQALYQEKLSMQAGGRKLRQLITGPDADRPKALYVTYRYNDPPRGGGEFYVNRLVAALASNGWLVEVVSPEAEQIYEDERFGARFVSGNPQPTTIGLPHVRSAKFPIDAVGDNRDLLQDLWAVQPEYEETYLKGLGWLPTAPALAWGWAYPEEDGRWFMTRAGIFSPSAARLTISGRANVPLWLQFFTEAGDLLWDEKVEGAFVVRGEIRSGFTLIEATSLQETSHDDARPLAAFVKRVEVDDEDILSQVPAELWTEFVSHKQIYRAHAEARLRHREPRNLALGDCRNPSASLLEYLDTSIANYDLVITHNAVFGTTTHAIAAAKRADVPSIMVPHLHLEDDFYHFGDVLKSCADATATLACPSLTRDFLQEQGVAAARLFTPGVDIDEQFTTADASEFRQLLGTHDDFVLILGRKARAKGYEDVILAVREMGERAPLIVMIGPDDDQRSINENGVMYLGHQSRSIVRGALMECVALINMSRSESFGMVILEAGLARKPVIANAGCAAFVDLIQDGINGYLVRPHELQDKLALLVDDDALRRRMGAAGHEFAQSFDWKRVEQDFVQIANDLIRADR